HSTLSHTTIPLTPPTTLFPYTTLFRSRQPLLEILAILDLLVLGGLGHDPHVDQERQHVLVLGSRVHLGEARSEFFLGERDIALTDRKSTRLNSSHVKISYAVFCLKKKN